MFPAKPPSPQPVPQPTESYWLSQPLERIHNVGRDDALLEFAETVIIGPGITGPLIAHDLAARGHLTKGTGNGKASVVMLEARSVCSGATGRNGGHIKPDYYKSFNQLQDRYGPDMALQLCQFEVHNRDEMIRKENDLADVAELVETRAVDLYMTENAWKEASGSFDALSSPLEDSELGSVDGAHAEDGQV